MFHQLQTDIRDTRQLVASHIVVDGDVERVAITQIQFLDFSRNRSRCDTHPADRLSLLVEDMNLNSIRIDVTRRVSLVTDYQTKVAIGKTMVDTKAQIDITSQLFWREMAKRTVSFRPHPSSLTGSKWS